MRVTVASPVLEELLHAIGFYDNQSRGLGRDLLEEFDDALEQISRLPGSGAPYHHGTRRIVLRRFPFNVVYRVRGDLAEVVAMAHQRREPDYWVERT